MALGLGLGLDPVYPYMVIRRYIIPIYGHVEPPGEEGVAPGLGLGVFS